MNTLTALARQLADSTDTTITESSRASDTSEAVSQEIEQSRETTRRSLQEIEQLSTAVTEIEAQLGALSSALQGVAEVANGITTIARQTNLLALNATIEATRAGEIGKAFAVVAEHVKVLAKQTGDATSDIHTILNELTQLIEVLLGQGGEATVAAQAVREGTLGIDEVLDAVASAVQDVETEAARIASALSDMRNGCNTGIARLEHLVENTQKSAESIERTTRDNSPAGIEHLLREGLAPLHGQANQLVQVNEAYAEVAESSKLVDVAARNAQHVASTAANDLDKLSTTANGVLKDIDTLHHSVDTINSRLLNLNEALNRISKVARGIADIAKQTNLLALNATIEAARVGNAGRGFATVAEEVKDLAGRTAEATASIDSTLEQLRQQAEQLTAQGSLSLQRAETVRAGTREVSNVVDMVASSMSKANQNATRIVDVAPELEQTCGHVIQALEPTANSATDIVQALDRLNKTALRR
ncbi:methyl-accepting chemotaxis protein [Alkalilimnicola ehrlichii]|uniref:methyl-accepting chemotaxis protein n=1 Tax=Alkalilimnicola ehrlichii TaxID=351052 RepID=UPI0015F27DB3|nr:methyl-accepting chemotaxis protein [Alkalilimnicola ehrlichii]